MLTDFQEGLFPSHWDPAWLGRRKAIERNRLGLHGPGQPLRASQPWPYRMVAWGLKAGRLYERGWRNFKDVRGVVREHRLEGWPAGLDGLRILQLSDLHIDLDPALLPEVCRLIPKLDYDMAVITGDFWEGRLLHSGEAVQAVQEIRQTIGDPPFGLYGVLGNHDSLALACAVEQMGIRILVNEAVVIGEPGKEFALAGVDDAFLFRIGDVQQAAGQCPKELPRILLSHSPQLAPLANEAGFSLMLSGHTHGGQICLPGGRSIITMPEIPPRIFRGPWRQGRLQGYTSTGTGACHVPVRFNCPPEMVVHVIRRAV